MSLDRLSVTRKRSTPPSNADASEIDNSGGSAGSSSSMIVPTASASPSVAPLGTLSVTVKVSFGSSVVSSRVCTSNVRSIVPGPNVSVSDAAS